MLLYSINYIVKKLLQDKFWIRGVMIESNTPGKQLGFISQAPSATETLKAILNWGWLVISKREGLGRFCNHGLLNLKERTIGVLYCNRYSLETEKQRSTRNTALLTIKRLINCSVKQFQRFLGCFPDWVLGVYSANSLYGYFPCISGGRGGLLNPLFPRAM